MSDFKTVLPEGTTLDPKKRVNHVTGLVMGVDEFRQDQLYFRERDHLHQRSLHGYGTVLGLGVSVRDDSDGRPEVLVAGGLAVTPRGESVCVPLAQCAGLDSWLERHRDALEGSPPAPPGPVSLWVTLCYRECETDPVPVLGDPCRTLEDATSPSRLQDDFQLELRLEPPEQEEEEAVRAFGELLRSIEIGAAGGLSPEDLADRVRALPDLGSPATIELDAETAGEAIVLALRTWVTEVRPELAEGAAGCPGGGEPCIQLARLDFDVAEDGGALVVDGDVTVDESERPFLLSTRLLQEWMAILGSSASGEGVGVHAALGGLGADDHPQYLLVDPGDRSLITDLSAGENRIRLLSPGQGSGDAVEFDQAIKQGDSAGGDLIGTFPSPTVRRLRNRPISTAVPTQGQVLTFFNSQWRPRDLPPVEATAASIPQPLATISRQRLRNYRIWMHVDGGDNRPEIPILRESSIRLLGETSAGPTFLSQLRIRSLQPISQLRNAFQLVIDSPEVAGESEQVVFLLTRILFITSRIEVSGGQSLFQMARDRGITYVGQEPGETGVVTQYIDRTGDIIPG